MELIDIIQHLRDFYIQKIGQPPREITMGRYWYEKAREERIVEMCEPWSDHRGFIAGMKIDVCPRDDYKLAIEDFKRSEKRQYRFDLRD